ncbi:MAG TPA: UxaA family hydrolase [Candidatus Avamphibacillus sp.]|nr:UxaA family hydrolase [Candidatus Avamphibacillus sp.]
MDEQFNALMLDEKDNVAVVLQTLRAGDLLSIQDEVKKVEVIKSIPYGHKAALSPIPKDHRIYKYGECMGIATQDIEEGDHVHESNVRGLTEEDKSYQEEGINIENI